MQDVVVTITEDMHHLIAQAQQQFYREHGMMVSPETIVQGAAVRGLRAMLPSQPQPQPQPTPPVAAPVVAPVVTPAAPTPPVAPLPQLQPHPEMPTAPQVTTPAAAQVGAAQPPPSTWARDDTFIPDADRAMHDWYAAKGWHRYVAQTPRGLATLYWSPIAAYRPLADTPYDVAIKKVTLQGYGVCHQVPEGWHMRGANFAEELEGGLTAQHASDGRARVITAGS